MLEIDGKQVTKNLPINLRMAETQPEYITLPANRNSGVLSFAFKLKFKGLLKAILKRRIYVYLLVGSGPMQPIHVNVDEKNFEEYQQYAVDDMTPKSPGCGG